MQVCVIAQMFSLFGISKSWRFMISGYISVTYKRPNFGTQGALDSVHFRLVLRS
jgi:hypothetical protein